MSRFSIPVRNPRRARSRLSRLVTLVLAAGGLAALATPTAATAAGPTSVVLDFDNAGISQYTLGYQQALQPHGAKATFYASSGVVGGGPAQMSWAQLGALATAGNDIGGKTVNATNLTTDPNPTAQVCNDRAAILSHGLTPVGLAYPGGANNATVQGIVKSCGYGNAYGAGCRRAPSHCPGELVRDPGLRARHGDAGEHAGAGQRGASTGAWSQLVIGRVCSQTLDPANYTSCSAASGHIELGDLNTFLDWMANAGQPGGAPAGAPDQAVGAVVGQLDTSAPTTSISLQRPLVLEHAVLGCGERDAVRHRHRFGRRQHPLHDRRQRPHAHQPDVHRCLQRQRCLQLHDGQVRSWDYRQRRVRPDAGDPGAEDTLRRRTTITCNDAACGASAYVATVTVELAATDTGGSGWLRRTTRPTARHPRHQPDVHGPFTLNAPGTYTVRYFSTDHAGNAEQVQPSGHGRPGQDQGVPHVRQRHASASTRWATCKALQAAQRHRDVLRQLGDRGRSARTS